MKAIPVSSSLGKVFLDVFPEARKFGETATPL